jgi:hypothetical protein
VDPRDDLRRKRRRRRRAASLSFFAAGVGFGTCLYLLRAHFQRLAEPPRLAAFLALVVIVAALFWVGARADAEVDALDEELRALDEQRDRRL